MRVVVVTTHPIQYQAPLFRQLAKSVDLHVVFMTRSSPGEQAASGFGVEFEWDTPVLEGYAQTFADNLSKNPASNRFNGIVLCDHARLFSSLKPEALLVMGWFPRGYLQAITWAARSSVPLVCRGESNLQSGRSFLRRGVKQVYFRWLFGHFDTFACIGTRNRELYLHYGVPQARLFDAPYAVDTEFFEQQYASFRPPQRRPGPWRIGFSGKLILKKRPLDLLLAVARCRAKARIQVVLIGDGPLREELAEASRRLGVPVEFRGFLNQTQIVKHGYADLDAIVLPSGETETWGLVVNEAMTGGIPAIVSDLVGCAPDLIQDGETGWLFESGNVEQLATRIDSAIAKLDAGCSFSRAVLARIKNFSLTRAATGILQSLHATLP